jgi:hypothetical protein
VVTGASAEIYFGLMSGLPPGVPGGGITGMLRTDLGGRLGQTGVDMGGRVNDTAGAVELMTEGFARTAAYALVRLVWHCLIRLGPRRVWSGIPADGGRRVLERPACLGKS